MVSMHCSRVKRIVRNVAKLSVRSFAICILNSKTTTTFCGINNPSLLAVPHRSPLAAFYLSHFESAARLRLLTACTHPLHSDPEKRSSDVVTCPPPPHARFSALRLAGPPFRVSDLSQCLLGSWLLSLILSVSLSVCDVGGSNSSLTRKGLNKLKS